MNIPASVCKVSNHKFSPSLTFWYCQRHNPHDFRRPTTPFQNQSPPQIDPTHLTVALVGVPASFNDEG